MGLILQTNQNDWTLISLKILTKFSQLLMKICTIKELKYLHYDQNRELKNKITYIHIIQTNSLRIQCERQPS